MQQLINSAFLTSRLNRLGHTIPVPSEQYQSVLPTISSLLPIRRSSLTRETVLYYSFYPIPCIPAMGTLSPRSVAQHQCWARERATRDALNGAVEHNAHFRPVRSFHGTPFSLFAGTMSSSGTTSIVSFSARSLMQRRRQAREHAATGLMPVTLTHVDGHRSHHGSIHQILIVRACA